MCNVFNNEKIFYKYISLNNNPYAFDLLKGKLYFSYPNQFNDPFDSKIEYKKDMTKKNLLINYKKACERHNYPVDEQKINNLSREQIKDMLNKMNNNGQTDALKIYCLSERYDSILMWSHYADKHQGICIGVKTLLKNNKYTIDALNNLALNKDNSNIFYNTRSLTLVKCKYRKRIPPKCTLFEEKDKLYAFLTTKYRDWKYEKEYRIILDAKETSKTPVEIDKNNIVEIILGMNITNINKRKVINYIHDEFTKEYRPKLFQCKQIRGQYAIEKEDISMDLL